LRGLDARLPQRGGRGERHGRRPQGRHQGVAEDVRREDDGRLRPKVLEQQPGLVLIPKRLFPSRLCVSFEREVGVKFCGSDIFSCISWAFLLPDRRPNHHVRVIPNSRRPVFDRITPSQTLCHLCTPDDRGTVMPTVVCGGECSSSAALVARDSLHRLEHDH